MYDRKELKVRQQMLHAELVKLSEELDSYENIPQTVAFGSGTCNYADECCAVQERSTVRSLEGTAETYLTMAHDIVANIFSVLVGSVPDQVKANPPINGVPIMATAEMNARSAESLVRRLHELQSLIS